MLRTAWVNLSRKMCSPLANLTRRTMTTRGLSAVTRGEQSTIWAKPHRWGSWPCLLRLDLRENQVKYAVGCERLSYLVSSSWSEGESWSTICEEAEWTASLVRWEDSSPYPPNTLVGPVAGIQLHLRKNSCLELAILKENNPMFAWTRAALDARMKSLTQQANEEASQTTLCWTRKCAVGKRSVQP